MTNSTVTESAQPQSSGQHRSQFIEQSTLLLDAMANSNRLAIVSELIGKEINVNTLSEMVGLSQSALSQHLSKLHAAGLVTRRRDAQMVYYSCNSGAAIAILQMLSEVVS